jgi:molybdopterin converting factor small subunit
MKKPPAFYRKENDMNTAEVYLFGSLSHESKGNKAHPIQYALQEPISLNDLFHCLGIFSDRVQLAMVNYRAVPLDHLVHPGDRIALFPKEYAIFADWKNFRG